MFIEKENVEIIILANFKASKEHSKRDSQDAIFYRQYGVLSTSPNNGDVIGCVVFVKRILKHLTEFYDAMRFMFQIKTYVVAKMFTVGRRKKLSSLFSETRYVDLLITEVLKE